VEDLGDEAALTPGVFEDVLEHPGEDLSGILRPEG